MLAPAAASSNVAVAWGPATSVTPVGRPEAVVVLNLVSTAIVVPSATLVAFGNISIRWVSDAPSVSTKSVGAEQLSRSTLQESQNFTANLIHLQRAINIVGGDPLAYLPFDDVRRATVVPAQHFMGSEPRSGVTHARLSSKKHGEYNFAERVLFPSLAGKLSAPAAR